MAPVPSVLPSSITITSRSVVKRGRTLSPSRTTSSTSASSLYAGKKKERPPSVATRLAEPREGQQLVRDERGRSRRRDRQDPGREHVARDIPVHVPRALGRS